MKKPRGERSRYIEVGIVLGDHEGSFPDGLK
jgi:hypothetical protein